MIAHRVTMKVQNGGLPLRHQHAYSVMKSPSPPIAAANTITMITGVPKREWVAELLRIIYITNLHIYEDI